MSGTTTARGSALAHWFAELEPGLWQDIVESGAVPAETLSRARDEWRALALYACVRGLVAGGGFSRDTADAVDQLHATATRDWSADARAMTAERYAEYGGIGQALQHAGAGAVDGRLGEAAAAHAAGPANEELAEVFAALHASLADAAAEVVRAPHPPLALLHAAGARLTRAGHGWALGGSGLLFALGLADHVGDWDLQTDASPEDCERACAGLPQERWDHNGCHADHKLRLWSGEAEIVIRFAFATPRGVVRLPLVQCGEWQGVPLAAPESWAVAYALLAELEGPPSRAAKSERLLAHMAGVGARTAAIESLLAQPLPAALAARLAALPRR